jgi:acyl-CoA thioester hydrolase
VTGEPVRLGTEGAESLILAEARITYRAPAFHGETITVETRATRLGRSSFTLEHRLTAREGSGPSRLVATSESILVRYDYAADAPIAISAAHRDAIEAFEGSSLSG